MTGSFVACFGVVAALLGTTAHAHFTIDGPAPSREKQVYGDDDTRFWPIQGGDTLRPQSDCLSYPRGQVASLTAGESLRVHFEIGNSARHIGLCTAWLIDLSTGGTVGSWEEPDCVARSDAMHLTLPSQSCHNCVVKIKVAAVHLGPDNPEYYDSCMDVDIADGSADGGSKPGPAPVRMEAKDEANDAKNTNPGDVAVSYDENSEDEELCEEDDINCSDDGGSADGGSKSGPAPVRMEAKVEANDAKDNNPGDVAPSYHDNTADGECIEGYVDCSDDGTQFIQCAHGVLVGQTVAPGTKCTTMLTGLPVIAAKDD
ncbi:hypothetical protein RI367_005534 [Sorochytrium milnesiophthora]